MSTENIIKNTGDLFYDDQIPIDIDSDGSYDSTICYSYSRLGPVGTCSNTSLKLQLLFILILRARCCLRILFASLLEHMLAKRISTEIYFVGQK